MTTITVELSKLQLSPLNVRQVREGDAADDTSDLEATIADPHVGLLSPLIVHHMKKPKGSFGVLAGGRRLLALQRLRDRGTIAADYAVTCTVRDEDAITSTELSVIENTARVALSPAQEFQAFAKLAADNADETAIATRFGVTVLHVRQRMRLGQLHPDILAALDDGKITLDLAKAYAATADQALQIRVFEEQLRGYGHYPHSVRSAIQKAGSAYDTQKMLQFVGRAAYLDAGGHLEEDLFGGGQRVVHPGTLSELYYAKLDAEAAKLASKLPDNVQIATSDTQLGQWVPAQPRLTAEQDARRVAIDERCDVIERRLEEIAGPVDDDAGGDIDLDATAIVADRPEDADEVAELQGELKALEQESEAILDTAVLDLPDGPILAHAVPTAEGLDIRNYYRPAGWQAEGSTGGSSTSSGYTPAPSAAQRAKTDHGLSADSTEVLRSHRREVLRAMMVNCDTEGGTRTAGDYLTFAALRVSISTSTSWTTGAAVGVSPNAFGTVANPVLGGNEVRDQIGSKRWARAIADLTAADWFTEKDLQAAFAKFTELPRFERDAAMAVAAAMFLDRSLRVPGFANPVHDQIAFLLGTDDDETVRDYWRPDAAFFARLSKKWCVAAVQECSPKTAKIIAKLPAADVASACERFFRADAAAIAEFDMLPGTVKHARRWVPAYLKFNDGPPGPRLFEQAADQDATRAQAVAA